MMLPQSQFPAGKLKGWPCVLLEGWALSSQPREPNPHGQASGKPGKDQAGVDRSDSCFVTGSSPRSPAPGQHCLSPRPCPAPASLLVGHL